MTLLRTTAFSLVELSIVLVILGLLTGGILAGRSLIESGETRAQLAQIDKYETAIHAFRDKYLYLPGDLPAATATSLNMTSGGGNGDGFFNGWNGTTQGYAQYGEPVAVWMQLSSAGLIEGNFTGNPSSIPSTAAAIPLYYPVAELPGNYVYAWSCSPIHGICPSSYNFLTVGGINSVASGWQLQSPNGNIEVIRAWNMDMKIDDGAPFAGAVITARLNGGASWSAWTTGSGGSSTCSDNPSGAAGVQIYGYDTAPNRQNCALSFRL